jgi:zinc protease
MGKAYRLGLVALPLLALATPLTAKTQANPPPGATRTAPWNSETSDLPADDSIIYGRLPNGLRYAIRPNNRPQNQVLIRMAFDFGSAAEADDERGLAHFIEHMAFNGTTNVPEGEMVKMLERLGLAFGADTNASTGYTMTDYRLDLPKSDPALIERAMFLMRETASEIVFDPAAVDRERGVVIAEMRQRDNYQSQSNDVLRDLFYPGSFYATRNPIGKKEVLETAPAERLKALYQKWYTPDRARIVVVGPIDPVAIEREIARKFGNWKGSSAALGEIDRCQFDTARRGESGLFVHPEINETIQIEQILPDKKRPDTFDSNLLAYKMNVAASIVQDRLARKSRKEDIPYLGGGSNFSAGFCDQHARVGMSVVGKDGSWMQLLPIVEQSVRQATEFGFSEQEVAEQIKRLDAAFANGRASEATTSSGVYANTLSRLEDDVISSAEQRQMIWLQIRPFLTADAVSREFATWFGQLNDPMIFLSTRKGDGLEKQALANAFAASRSVAIAPPVARREQNWAYEDFGAAASIVSDGSIKDLGIRTLRLSNGVFLNLKKTDFEADRIRWSVRIDGGDLHFPKEQQYLTSFMNGTYVGGGLGKYDSDDLRAALAGSTAAPIFYSSSDHFGGAGSVVVKDLERQMQLITAYLTDPGKREEAVRLFRRGLPEWYSRLDATPQSALSVAIGKIMTDGDPRFTVHDAEKLPAADFAELDKALGDALASNRLEIGLTGAIDEDAAIAIIAKTFGTLPPRKTEARDYNEARKTSWSSATGSHDVPHRGEANQLSWRRIWTTTDDSDGRLQDAMDIFAKIARIRLLDELREKLGATYGASAYSDMSSTFTGRGTFGVSTEGDPKDLAVIEAAVDSVIAELLAAPVSSDLFERARKPKLEAYADWKKQNGTWSRLTAQAQSDPDRLQRFRVDEEQFRSITADEVWKAAKQLLDGKQSFTFRALPKKADSKAP